MLCQCASIIPSQHTAVTETQQGENPRMLCAAPALKLETPTGEEGVEITLRLTKPRSSPVHPSLNVKYMLGTRSINVVDKSHRSLIHLF